MYGLLPQCCTNIKRYIRHWMNPSNYVTHSYLYRYIVRHVFHGFFQYYKSFLGENSLFFLLVDIFGFCFCLYEINWILFGKMLKENWENNDEKWGEKGKNYDDTIIDWHNNKFCYETTLLWELLLSMLMLVALYCLCGLREVEIKISKY